MRHSAHIRATKTCSITSAGATGISMTSRVRCTQPPDRPVPHSGHDSGACITRRVGSARRRAKPWRRRFRGPFCLRLTPLGGRLITRHPRGRAPRVLRRVFQLIYPPPQRRDDRLLLSDGRLLLGNDRQQSLPRTRYGGLPARAIQVRCSLHHSLNDTIAPGPLASFRFTSTSLNSYLRYRLLTGAWLCGTVLRSPYVPQPLLCPFHRAAPWAVYALFWTRYPITSRLGRSLMASGA